MRILKFHIYLADLEPSFGTEPGKVRPVVVVQTNDYNDVHTSTIVCLLTTQITENAYPLRIRVTARQSSLSFDSDIMTDQVRAIDNRRFIKHIGVLPTEKSRILMDCLSRLILD